MRGSALVTIVGASLALLVAVGARPLAHHSIASVYDFSKRVPLDGRVVRFEFINPHPFLTLEVAGTDRPRRWRLEMDNRWELAELGFRDDLLQPGERVSVVINPARSQPDAGYVRILDRPSDGFKYRHHD